MSSSLGLVCQSDFVRYGMAGQLGFFTPFMVQSDWYICGHNGRGWGTVDIDAEEGGGTWILGNKKSNSSNGGMGILDFHNDSVARASQRIICSACTCMYKEMDWNPNEWFTGCPLPDEIITAFLQVDGNWALDCAQDPSSCPSFRGARTQQRVGHQIVREMGQALRHSLRRDQGRSRLLARHTPQGQMRCRYGTGTQLGCTRPQSRPPHRDSLPHSNPRLRQD